MAGLPPLPPITDHELTLAVYTHDSILPPAAHHDFKSPARLAFLGGRVLDQALAYHYFMKDPPMAVHDIQNLPLSPDFVFLLSAYDLKRKIRCSPEVLLNLETEPEARYFFHKHIGASFLQNGPEAIQQWVSKVLDPQAPAPNLPTGHGHSYQPGGAQPHSPSPPTNPFPPPYSQSNAATTPQGSTPGGNKFQILAQFNLVAQQNHYMVTYPARSEGPSHTPTWTVQCCVNGEVKGQGVGKSQKEAKEFAARAAWVAMGWGRLPE